MKFPFSRPELSAYAAEPFTTTAPSETGLTATFLGVGSVLLDDGETAIITDPFFSRPSVLRTLTRRIGPDPALIDRCLQRAGVTELAAVLVTHSHFDHAMDAPYVAERTGAQLIGSESTANLGRGHGLPESHLVVTEVGVPFAFGDFVVTMIESLHSHGDVAPGTIDDPLPLPARARAMKTGGTFSIVITHRGRTIIVHPSANFVPGALAGVRADVVYLGVGALGRQPADFSRKYWDEVVLATGARRALLAHWDDFFSPLDAPLRLPPYLFDDPAPVGRFLAERSMADDVDVRLPVAWARTDPFAAL